MNKPANQPSRINPSKKDSSSLYPTASFEKFKDKAISFLQKKIKRSQKRLAEREQTLKNCQEWEKEKHLGLLLQANLFQLHKGMKEIKIPDWQQNGCEILFVLDASAKPHEQAEKYFKRSRKLRLGEPHARRMLLEATKEITLLESQLLKISELQNLQELQHLCLECGIELEKKPQTKTAEKPPSKPFHCFFSETGLQIWVGKSAKDNDKLTFQCANGSDWWLHARDVPGSHIILKCNKDKDPDNASLHDAIELALRYSKLKDRGEGEVCLSQVKWLKKVKGTPGAVMVSKHKILYKKMDDTLWLSLKKRKL